MSQQYTQNRSGGDSRNQGVMTATAEVYRKGVAKSTKIYSNSKNYPVYFIHWPCYTKNTPKPSGVIRNFIGDRHGSS
jgi:hypothetical protein